MINDFQMLLNQNKIVIIHTSIQYQPSITLIDDTKVKEYFSQDNGFEKNELDKVEKMKVGDTVTLGCFNDIIVIKP